jgi:hypothetical protein
MRQNLDPALECVDSITDNPWFSTREGTEGEPLSTLDWVVFFDILLTSFNEVQREFPIYVRHHGSRLEPQLSVFYVDDLHLVSPSLKATIKSNSISSVFAMMFGREFAPAKLWVITTISAPGEVVLYFREWTPIVAMPSRTLCPWTLRTI